jgi:hydroxymethylpyrimidine/phosphomethylpyrimidine kinase
MLCGLEESSDCLYQQGQAIKMINERLHDPTHGTSDTAIGAVASLAIFAVSLLPSVLNNKLTGTGHEWNEA